MLRQELSCLNVRLLLSVLVLIDAGRTYDAVSGVDPVESHEARHFADDGHEALIDQLPHLLGVAHALVAPHRNIHRSSLPPSHRGRGHRPALSRTTPPTLANIGTRRITQMSDIRNFLGELLPRPPYRRSSRNSPSTHSGE